MREESAASSRMNYIAPAVVFAVALIARLGYLIALKSSILFDFLVVDAAFYDNWGADIASGNWMGGARPFYDPPLYAYFLGVVYKILGHDMFLIRLVQIFIGSAHCVLVYFIGNKIAGRKAGMIAGIFSALYITFIFYDAAIMKAFLTATLVDCMMLCAIYATESRRNVWWFLAGLSLGLTIMLTVNIMIFAFIGVAAFAYYIIRSPKGEGRVLAKSCAAWIVGVLVAIAPAAVRNYAVSGEFVLVSSYLGQNFYTGNNPYNPVGNYGRLPFVRANPKYEEEDFRTAALMLTGKKEMSPSELSGFWMKQSLKFIEDDPASFAKRLWVRFRIFWNRYETPDTYNLDFEANQFTPYLKLPFLNFGVVAPLGLVGMILAWKSRNKMWPLYIFLPVYMSTILPFFVFDRYRLPAVGGLIVFASVAIVEAIGFRKEKKMIVAAIIGVAVLAVAINIEPPGRVADYEGFMNLAAIYRQKGDLEKSALYYRKYIALNPSAWEGPYFLATVLREDGKYEEAVAEYGKAIKMAPELDDPYIGVAMCFIGMSGPEAAKSFYAAALEKRPSLLKTRAYYIKLLRSTDDSAKADEQAEILKSMNPEYYDLFLKSEKKNEDR